MKPKGLALAAGAGTRLRPLTLERPKPLCPVGDAPLLDWCLRALTPVTASIAVNVHHGREQVEAYLSARGGPPIHVSVEEGVALGTAGAVGQLRDWLDGAGLVVANADTWHRIDLAPFVEGWDGERVRILTSTPLPFGPRNGVVASLLPWEVSRTLDAEPSGLWELVWRDALAQGRVDAVAAVGELSGQVIDCGTPADYLRANLAWSGGRSVVGEGAVVEGSLERCVVWPEAYVASGEVLVDAIRTGERTVLVR